MKVSIITPSYNSLEYITMTIDSVLAQIYTNWEMIIVDDVSTDGSDKIIEQYIKRDKRVKLIRLKENLGPALARNRAIREATGRYIAFLDADDLWFPEKLEKQLNFMKKHKLSLVYSSYETIDEDGLKINMRIAKEYIGYVDMLKSNHIGNLTAIYDSKLIGKIYMDDMGHEDYILWLKILKRIGHTRGIVEPLAQYRILSTSISSNKIKTLKWQWRIYRKIEKLDILKSSYYFAWYAYYALMKRR